MDVNEANEPAIHLRAPFSFSVESAFASILNIGGILPLEYNLPPLLDYLLSAQVCCPPNFHFLLLAFLLTPLPFALPSRIVQMAPLTPPTCSPVPSPSHLSREVLHVMPPAACFIKFSLPNFLAMVEPLTAGAAT